MVIGAGWWVHGVLGTLYFCVYKHLHNKTYIKKTVILASVWGTSFPKKKSVRQLEQPR